MNLEQLKAKYPKRTIYQEGDPKCKCEGSGEMTTKSGSTYPCLCTCLSEPHSDAKRELLKCIGKAARKIKKDLTLL